MSVLRKLLVLASPLLVVACEAADTSPTEKAETKTDVQVTQPSEQPTAEFDEAKLRASFESIGADVVSITPASIDGLYEVETLRGMIFSNAEGDQFIAGTLYALNGNGEYVDVIAERKQPINAEKIKAYEDRMIVYPAENEKYVITVFTDTTCTYCVRLHHQMKGYNELGITVRYLAYPRQGPTGDVAQEMARIWCAEEPAAAMTHSKLGNAYNEENGDMEQCRQSIVEQYSLGRDLGISGTPAVFLSNGKLLAGYMPPAGMFQRIEQELAE